MVKRREFVVGAFYWCKMRPSINERGRNKEPYWTPVMFMVEDEEGPMFRCMDTRFPIRDVDYVEIGDLIRCPHENGKI